MQLEDYKTKLEYLHSLKLLGYSYIDEHLNTKVYTPQDLPNTQDELHSVISNCNLCKISNLLQCCCENLDTQNNPIVFIFKNNKHKHSINSLFQEILDNILKLDENRVQILYLLKAKIVKQDIKYIDELDICKYYTIKQLEILKPKIIVISASLVKYIFNKNIDINSNLRYNGSELFVVDDFENIIRNPSLKDKFFHQFVKIKSIMERK